MNKSKAFVINMLGSIITFLVSFGVSFFFTPYVTKVVGGEAYGFVGMANNMTNYITIITVALNSVAGRFITVKYHQNKKEEANQYFTSVLLANALMAAVIMAVAVPFIMNLEKFINVSAAIEVPVKYLFLFILLSFILTLVGTVYTTATFITNKLYLSSIANVIVALLKVFLLCLMFGFMKPNIAYVGIATCLSGLVGLILNVYYTKKLIPDIKIRKKYISFEKTKELVSSGIWNSITKISSILSDGLDLIITNLWISSYLMGQLSIAQTIPTYLASLLGMITSLFNPNLTKSYAEDNIKELLKELEFSMKLTGFFSNIVFAVVLVLGGSFYALWVPGEDYTLIYHLAVIIMMSTVVSGVTAGLNSIFMITNKLKVNSIFWLLISVFNICVVFILLNVTSLGVYAVAGVSKLVGTIANLTYLPIYSAKCLKVKWNTFYPLIFKYLLTSGGMVMMFWLIRQVIQVDVTWFSFLFTGTICGLLGCVLNFVMLFDKEEKASVKRKMISLLKRGKRAS